MILPDLNLLLYAYNPHMPQHDTARRWPMRAVWSRVGWNYPKHAR